jgi:hypothetical protein
MTRNTTIRVSPEQRDLLKDIKAELYSDPEKHTNGDALAAVLGTYQRHSTYTC